MIPDLDLVEVAQAMGDTLREAPAVDAGAVAAAVIDDAADRSLDPDPAVLLADLLVVEDEAGRFPAAESDLGTGDAMDGGNVIAVDDHQNEDVRRSERELPLLAIGRFTGPFRNSLR